ncbi:hypothetical protein TIFTF001_049667 [Ficus carica]|uniref:Uncharacterized protein n=1 Tax=Ficus carica TaxID=3494 RepID=A0AA87ZG57_FICCA|nr:hypothetical protein TIFTF001_049667 [Ficus carica]
MAHNGRFPLCLGEQAFSLVMQERSTAGRRRLTAEAVRGGNLQLYPEEEQHFVGHNERGKYNSAYSIGPLLPDVGNLPANSDAILWRAGSADCEMWDGHCHSF